MKFKLHHDLNELLTCDFCGAERFVLVPGRQVCNSELVADYIFFKCGECAQMGFWTHKRLIDKRSGTSRAVQKAVADENDGHCANSRPLNTGQA